MDRKESDQETTAVLAPSNTDIIPDKIILLNYFPLEVWTMILDQVEEQSEDFNKVMDNLSQTCPFFRTYYLPRCVNLMVPKVIQHLQNYLGLEFLKCRLICSSWNLAIQDYYHHHPSHLALTRTFLKTGEGSIDQKYMTESFQTEEQGSKFFNHFGFFGVQMWNPLSGRNVDIQPVCARKLLANYWRKISFCSFELPSHENGDLNTSLYHKLIQWLGRLRNVTVLKIAYNGNHPGSWDGQGEGRRNTRRRRVPDGPDAPCLEQLQFLKADNLPARLLDSLLEANSDIIKLEITRMHRGNKILTTRLENLRGFSGSFATAQEFLYFRGEWHGPWRLEELNLRFDKAENIQWTEILHRIQKRWANTLKQVEIELPKAKQCVSHHWLNLKGTRGFRWNLPKVTRLKMTLPGPVYLDFLLPMEKLEELHIALFGDQIGESVRTEMEESQGVEFVGMEENMQRSNIWEKFPQLRKLEVTCRNQTFRTFGRA